MSSTIHADDRAHFWRPVVWCACLTTVFAFLLDLFLLEQDRIGGWGAAGILAGAATGGALIGAAIAVATGWFATGMVERLTHGGALAPRRSFSREESLIARGRFAEARDALAEHLARDPADLDAALALAAVYRDHLREPGQAEQVLLDARRRPLTRAYELSVTNQLIDLYHAAGNRGRELAELARLADRFAGTDVGSRARDALRRIKAENA